MDGNPTVVLMMESMRPKVLFFLKILAVLKMASTRLYGDHEVRSRVKAR
jgi:hypothetical protein